MAITVARASSQYAEAASSPISSIVGTLACWYRPGTVGNGTALGVGRTSGGTQYLALGITGAGVTFLEVQGASTTDDALAGTLSAGAWSHICGVSASATSRTAYKDGVAGTANTTNTGAIAALSATTVGGLNVNGSRVSFADGDIAEAAVWDVALTAAEIASLAAGFSPVVIRPASLVFYAPLSLGASPEQDLRATRGLTFGAAGAAPTKATTHPRMFKPSGWLPVGKPAAAAGGGPTDLPPRRTLLGVGR